MPPALRASASAPSLCALLDSPLASAARRCCTPSPCECPSPGSPTSGAGAEEAPAPTHWVVTVQFKWARSGRYGSARCAPGGECVIVDAEGGEDIGMVIQCEAAAAPEAAGLPAVRGLATEEQQAKWRVELTAAEKQALRGAVTLLPENRVGFRIVHAAYRLDMLELTLYYTVSGRRQPTREQVLSHRDALSTHFGCTVQLALYEYMDQDAANRKILGLGRHRAATGPPRVAPPVQALPTPSVVAKIAHQRGGSGDSAASWGLSSAASDEHAALH
eukprot:TRINITY_DN18166_c0_g1_i1.p1 TRINITY_DN18166_c0_g1~~TRINITY_DN18166_c0_g1_i1.p1  ORF type:complete len:275 (+),score=84.83 TRINITY_DN18166_c0_g1_i1:85-909(+)